MTPGERLERERKRDERERESRLLIGGSVFLVTQREPSFWEIFR